MVPSLPLLSCESSVSVKKTLIEKKTHTQTIRRQFADELFECVCPFCGIGAERVKLNNVNLINKWFQGIFLKAWTHTS